MHLMAGFAIGQQRLQGGSQRLRLALILQQLFNQLAPGQQVRQRDVVGFNQPLRQPEGERLHAIANHHRAFRQHTLQRRRPGGQQRGVAGDHRIARLAVQHMHDHIRRRLSFNSLKLLPPFSINQRHHHLQIGIGSPQKLRGFQEVRTEHFDFRAAATGQQRQATHVVRDP